MGRILAALGLSVESFMELSPKVRQKIVELLLRWECEKEALPLMRKLSDLDPKGLLYRAHLAECLAACGRVDEAEAVVRELAIDHPGQPYTLAAAGSVHMAREDPEKALECYLRILQRNPNSTIALRRLASLYLDVGQADKSRVLADKAYTCCQSILRAAERSPESIPPVHPEVLRTLAAIHECRGDPKLAAEIREGLVRRKAAEIERFAELISLSRDEGSKSTAGSGSGVARDTSEKYSPVDITRALKELFGIDEFRPGQMQVVSGALAGESQLVVMPTGGGKSLCYQLPAAILDGTTLVISPLIALMKDQVEGLPPALRQRTTFINSTLSPMEMDRRLNRIVSGDYRLVYAAPERLRQAPFLHALERSKVALFVVDEVHCVSIWGHDFRPDYLFISPALDMLGQPPLLGMTATATPEMRREIEKQLGRKLSLVSAGTYRPNLRLEVKDVRTEEDKLRALLAICKEASGTGIVYVTSREKAEELSAGLRRNGVSAGFYHAGMERSARDAAQESFMSECTHVTVATIAFGMGIDKPDVRFVVHYSLPRSPESYYQEAGRAGRDGMASRCVLLYSPSDRVRLIAWMKTDQLDMDSVKQVYQSIREQLGTRRIGAVSDKALCAALGLDDARGRVAVSLLERVGLIKRHLDVPKTITLQAGVESAARAPEPAVERLLSIFGEGEERTFDPMELAELIGLPVQNLELSLLDWNSRGFIKLGASARSMLLEVLRPSGKPKEDLERMLADYRERSLQKINVLVRYAKSPICRHGFIARYFGEKPITNCGACDNCLGKLAEAPIKKAEQLSQKELLRAEASILQGMAKLPVPFGRKALIQAFTGSPGCPINKFEWEFLGSLSHLTPAAVGKVIDGLTLKGHVERAGKPLHPVLVLTRAGWQAMGNGDQ